jgi:hypothetical protein
MRVSVSIFKGHGGGASEANRHRPCPKVAKRHGLRRHRTPHAFGHLRGAGEIRDREQSDELFSAPAPELVLCPQDTGQALGHDLKDAIPCGMTLAVVNLLEVVDVDHGDGQALLVPASRAQQFV